MESEHKATLCGVAVVALAAVLIAFTIAWATVNAPVKACKCKPCDSISCEAK